MKSLLLLPVLVVLVSCKEPAAEVAVSQTRELTTKDESFKVNGQVAGPMFCPQIGRKRNHVR